MQYSARFEKPVGEPLQRTAKAQGIPDRDRPPRGARAAIAASLVR